MKDYMIRYLKEQGPQNETEVLKMVISLVSKIIKMSWLDHPVLRTTIQELIQLQNLSEQHLWISLSAIHDLIIEMSYSYRVRNLSVNRRIALNFRDSSLQ